MLRKTTKDRRIAGVVAVAAACFLCAFGRYKSDDTEISTFSDEVMTADAEGESTSKTGRTEELLQLWKELGGQRSLAEVSFSAIGIPGFGETAEEQLAEVVGESADNSGEQRTEATAATEAQTEEDQETWDDPREQGTEATAEQTEEAVDTELAGAGEPQLYSDLEHLAISNVRDYVNVRSGPGTSYGIVAKVYDDTVLSIMGREETEDGLWYSVVSGNVRGYVNARYFLCGDEAEEALPDCVQEYAVVSTDRLKVRREADAEADCIAYLVRDDRLKVIGEEDGWLNVIYRDGVSGYICSDYVTVVEEYNRARTAAEEERLFGIDEERLERQRNFTAAIGYNINTLQKWEIIPPTGTYENTTELRKAIVDYAMQFEGNRYIMGGPDLAGGTDCSGFTCYIYREFGYSIGRVTTQQYLLDGRSIEISEAQPGDIICYGEGDYCTHVAMYIGDGMVIHEANSRKGCIVTPFDWMENIIGAKNIID